MLINNIVIRCFFSGIVISRNEWKCFKKFAPISLVAPQKLTCPATPQPPWPVRLCEKSISASESVCCHIARPTSHFHSFLQLMEFLDPLWDELIVHNEGVRKELKHRTSSRLVETTYGAVGQQRRSLKESGAASTDQVDGASASVDALSATDEHDPLLGVTVSINKINI